MLITACVGRIVSDPTEEGRLRSCRLAVKLDKNQVIKLLTWSKDAPLVKDTMVFVIGKLTKIEDNHVQIEATLVCPVDQISPVALLASGGTKFMTQRQDQNQRPYYTFQVGSYENSTKSYTNVSVTSSHPLCKFSDEKRVLVFGTANTNTFISNKTGNEIHSINLRARELEITERKDNSNNGGGSGNFAAFTKTEDKGNMPF